MTDQSTKEWLGECPFCGVMPHEVEPCVYSVIHNLGCFFNFRMDWRTMGAKKLEAWNRREPSQRDELAIIKSFCEEVNRRAEGNMLKTGKLEGSHYAAMTQILKERHTLATKEKNE